MSRTDEELIRDALDHIDVEIIRNTVEHDLPDFERRLRASIT